LADSIQFLIYPPHLRTAATLPWEKRQLHSINFTTKVTHYCCIFF